MNQGKNARNNSTIFGSAAASRYWSCKRLILRRPCSRPGRDYFEALHRLRPQLEPLDWAPLCNGARSSGGGQVVIQRGQKHVPPVLQPGHRALAHAELSGNLDLGHLRRSD
jgi:hypothetical protein